MERDVAAVVDVRAGERRAAVIASRISCATAPATAAIGVTKRDAWNGATAAAIRRATMPRGAGPPPPGRAQQRQFGAELVEDRREASLAAA